MRPSPTVSAVPRAYLLRDGELRPLTRDASFVQLLLDSGELTVAEAMAHPRRSLVDNVSAVVADVVARRDAAAGWA